MISNAAETPAATTPTPEDWIARARNLEARGLLKQAVESAGRAVDAAPRDARMLYFRSTLYERMRQFAPAEADLNKAIELAPSEASLWYQRAVVRLRLAEFAGSVADFNQFITLRPSRAAGLWQLGIALFYAGKFDDARKQFELHRTVNPRDVENSAWHFASMAQVEGLDRARTAWMKVEGDTRIPMNEIQAVMRGETTDAAVLKAAEDVKEPRQRAEARFYAHLYLALLHGADQRPDLEARYAAEAARDPESFGIMGDIARLHVDWVVARLRNQKR